MSQWFPKADQCNSCTVSATAKLLVNIAVTISQP